VSLMAERRAKIVCTLGPASGTSAMIEKLVAAGMDVARLNFSHGTHEDHAALIKSVRRASQRLNKGVAVLADLQGPKIRTGLLEGGTPVRLRFGQKFVITTRDVKGTSDGVSTTFGALTHAVRKGDTILLADGSIALRVLTVRGQNVTCHVENGGSLGEHKGINLPGVKLKIPSLTKKDVVDLNFALDAGVEYVALSFVRTAKDVEAAKMLINRTGKSTPVIAKLEKPEAIDHLDEILATADAVMVARGDLGVEMTPEKVPVVQKQIISRARNALVPVITATQMLDSMEKNPRPTRAEASDVANAIFDGSDALMLSGETAAGQYPLEAVTMMNRIICEAEANNLDPQRPARFAELRISEVIAGSVCRAAEELKMKAVVVFTETGASARLVSKYRPRVPIMAFTPNPDSYPRMGLLWGVAARRTGNLKNIDELTREAEARLRDEDMVKDGDVIGIIAGTPVGARGSTNLMRLRRIGAIPKPSKF
jgi:pyruvate kinase